MLSHQFPIHYYYSQNTLNRYESQSAIRLMEAIDRGNSNFIYSDSH